MGRAVLFPVPCEVAYDYLVAPDNRAEWQSSLRAVEDVRGADGVAGQTWTDVTNPGLRPRMELTDADRPTRWSERGTWGRFAAELTLDFAPAGSGCAVTATMALHARGVAWPLGVVLQRLAPYAVRADLRSAAEILAARA
ncbi:MAG: polyketide cyclase [Nocardioides sp.]|nr:polyketide cyclase [Nocardioides sp.]